MKRYIRLGAALIAVLLFSACSASSTLQAEYDALLAENELQTQEIVALNEVIASLQEAPDVTEAADDAQASLVDAMLTGGFVATFRGSVPSYTLDDTTPAYAIVTEFQSTPFLIYLPTEMFAELEVNTAYYFEIEDTPIGEISEQAFNQTFVSAEEASASYGYLTIVAYREASEAESGLSSPQLTLKKGYYFR